MEIRLEEGRLRDLASWMAYHSGHPLIVRVPGESSALQFLCAESECASAGDDFRIDEDD